MKRLAELKKVFEICRASVEKGVRKTNSDIRLKLDIFELHNGAGNVQLLNSSDSKIDAQLEKIARAESETWKKSPYLNSLFLGRLRYACEDVAWNEKYSSFTNFYVETDYSITANTFCRLHDSIQSDRGFQETLTFNNVFHDIRGVALSKKMGIIERVYVSFTDWKLNENVYNTHFYFAYGSNLSLEQLKKRSVYYDKTPAKLYDYELAFNKMAKRDPRVGMGNIIPSKGSVVEGIVYELDNLSVSVLDNSEGVPTHYNKKIVEVELQNGEKMNVFVYIANPNMVKDGLLPTSSYLKKFLVDAEKYMSKEYIERIKNQPTISSEEEKKFYGVRENRYIGPYLEPFLTFAELFFEEVEISNSGDCVKFITPATKDSPRTEWAIGHSSDVHGMGLRGSKRIYKDHSSKFRLVGYLDRSDPNLKLKWIA